ncbi:MAG: DUF2945 domain-containing protein [Gammaproteobacteria bacterium]|jgi:hypothetical protein
MARQVGDEVSWNWSNGTASVTIKQIYEKRVSKTLKGSEIVRNADADNPAYLIEQDDGDQVLKSDSELN